PHLTRSDSRARYAPGTEFAMDIITMIGNTGTYLDSPFHRYEGGSDLAGLSLETLVDLPTEVFHLTDSLSRGIPASVFWDRPVAVGRALHGGAAEGRGVRDVPGTGVRPGLARRAALCASRGRKCTPKIPVNLHLRPLGGVQVPEVATRASSPPKIRSQRSEIV